MRSPPREVYTFYCWSQDGTGRTINSAGMSFRFEQLMNLPKVKWFELRFYIGINPAPYIDGSNHRVMLEFNGGGKCYNQGSVSILGRVVYPGNVSQNLGSKTLPISSGRYSTVIARPDGPVVVTATYTATGSNQSAIQPSYRYFTLTPIYDPNYEPPEPMENPFNFFD